MKNYKCISRISGLLFLVLLQFTFTTAEDEELKEMIEIFKQCSEKFLDPNDDVSTREKVCAITMEESHKCFVNCLYQKFGMVDDDGKILKKHFEKMEKNIKEEDKSAVKEQWETCIDDGNKQEVSDECDRAFAVHLCHMKEFKNKLPDFACE